MIQPTAYSGQIPWPLPGYLNYRTEKESQHGWANMGPTGSFAGGFGKSSAYYRLADLNGDRKAGLMFHGRIEMHRRLITHSANVQEGEVSFVLMIRIATIRESSTRGKAYFLCSFVAVSQTHQWFLSFTSCFESG